MSSIVAPAIEAYAEQHATPPEPHLATLARETHEQLQVPQMLTGTVEGRLLEMLVFVQRPSFVLEIGTYSGYSALAMAALLPPSGRIVTCEISEKNADFAQRHFDSSPYGDRIEVRRGPALETLRALDGPFDLVFIDADKPNYGNYLDAVLPKLSSRGLIVVDNTLWSGHVVDPENQAKWTVAIRTFNARVRDDPNLVSVMLTVRDGVTLIRPAAGAGAAAG